MHRNLEMGWQSEILCRAIEEAVDAQSNPLRKHGKFDEIVKRANIV